MGEHGSFSLVTGTPTEHVHIAFPARDDATVDAFHRAAIAAGYRDNGAPGVRPVYHPGYYGAFVLDPDGQQRRAREPQPLSPYDPRAWTACSSATASWRRSSA